MQLTGITDLLHGSTAYRDILLSLQDNKGLSLNVIRSARAFVIGTLANDWSGPVIILTSRIKRAYNISQQLPVWMPQDDEAANIIGYTEPTAQFYERVPWLESVITGRMESLSALMNDTSSRKPVIVSSARALMQRTMPMSQFRRASISLKPGQRWQIDKLLSKWVKIGYEPTPIVVKPGTFSRRGGVIDIFPIAEQLPIRIDFFDDEIETIRQFDPSTQRSNEHLSQVFITPAREALPEHTPQIANHLMEWFNTLPPVQDDMTTPAADAESLSNGAVFPYLEHYLPYMYANPVSLLDYTTDDALIVIEDWDTLRDTIEEISHNAKKIRTEQIKSGLLPADYPQPHLDWTMIKDALAERTILHLGNQHPGDTQAISLQHVEQLTSLFTPGERFGGQLRPMLTDVRRRRDQGDGVAIVTQQVPRLTQLWQEQEASEFIPTETDILTQPEMKSVLFVNGELQEGWSLTLEKSVFHLLTDAEIFGWNRPEPRRRKTTRHSRPPEADYADWKEGDHVVHVDYGVGQFLGLRHRTVDGNEREYLVAQYAGTDMLYVPIHQADRLTKYVGAGDTPPSLNKLGRPEWARIKSRAKKAVEEEAQELLELYALRVETSGYAFSADMPWQHELEASFPYIETEDQLKTINDVKLDMESPHTMDRMICGDVGYGKTEVALRAAFKAVMDGKQVAILTPTTVLARQHYETFSNRLAPFPVTVEMMSRFRSKTKQSQMLPKLASGEVDIVIGTHRILSKDIEIKDLGLVIIDEEQRFGVKQKEHFKKLRTQVDILTLTATPIPRSLYMGLTGIRDISRIQTPPEERLPVVTHIGTLDKKLIRQAIIREIERGGQVFVVHNRIRSIEKLRAQLEELVPEARIVVAHGRMHANRLEEVMTDFSHGQYDILLSTSIIENGIDIPNANTLIVDRADWFGMAQLYQLRGRVGRSAQQAFAYFFHPRKQTETSQTRLDTLAENTDLGAGFQVAMRDLEIRGSGDILSTRQTGHIAAVGLHLYTQLVTQAIRKLKGEPDNGGRSIATVATSGIVIDLPIPAYLPDDWLPEIALRLQIYRRIATLTSQEQVTAMRAELHDRFGEFPGAVEGLLYQIETKLLGQRVNATHIIGRDKQVQIKLPYLGEINRLALELELGDDVEVTRTAIMFPLIDDDNLWKKRLQEILETLAIEIETSPQKTN